MNEPLIEVSSAIHESAELRPLIETANGWLSEMLAELPDPVRAEWDRVDNSPGVDMVGLCLRSPNDSALGLIRVNDLTNRAEVEHRINSMIRFLYRRESHLSLKKLLELGAAGGDQ